MPFLLFLSARLFISVKKNPITAVIILMENLLDSDWLRAVQFKGNTSARSAIPVQITLQNSGM